LGFGARPSPGNDNAELSFPASISAFSLQFGFTVSVIENSDPVLGLQSEMTVWFPTGPTFPTALQYSQEGYLAIALEHGLLIQVCRIPLFVSISRC
jgi:hypothetical protein